MKHSERNKLTPELLKQIANKIGDNWRYHQILSDETNKTCRGFYLYNGAGLYINIRYCYGEKLPQWSIEYKHPKHNHMQTVLTIGCSITKSLNSIVQDLNNRLLAFTHLAYEKLQSVTEEYLNVSQREQNNAFIIEALKKVINLNPTYDHRFSDSWRIQNEQGSEYGKLHRFANNGKFRITLDDVSPDEIIQIAQILKR